MTRIQHACAARRPQPGQAWLARFALLMLALVPALAASLAAAGEAPAQRILFLGDSITQAGARPGGYVSLVRESLDARHKELGIEVIGAGVSGNRVPDLEKRLEQDVISKRPSLVVVYIGINDVWHTVRGRGTSKEDYEQGLRRVIQRLQEAGARVILCTPSVIGEKHDGSNELDPLLDQYCDISRRIAGETNSQLLDLRKAFLEHLREHNPDNLEKNVLTTDGVHLNAAGNRFLADQMLDGLTSAFHGPLRLRHLVLFKFKEEVSEDQVRQVVEEFAALPGKVDAIVDFEYGTDVSVEGKSQGFTHGFLVSFRDEKGRDAYLPHPAHQEFVKLVGPLLDGVLVFDYWSNR